jgi:uncharacterized protein YyaL (SSP411 family)
MRWTVPMMAAMLGSCGGGGAAEPGAPSVPPEPSLPGIPSPSSALDGQLAEQLAAKPTGYAPRTEHLEDGAPRFTNRLIGETSPYLLQHAHNPVNWWPWGPEAFARAKALDRPILLSVGYATCHWCHVMERESFEDLDIAAYVNANFVAVKVDREERPDVDDVYMSAVYAFRGRGGWPMTVVMTPDAEPFFAATYLPPRDGDRGRSRGLLSILQELATMYAADRGNVLEQAAAVRERIRIDPGGVGSSQLPDPTLLANGVASFRKVYDPQWGGFSRAPKFPRPAVMRFLLRQHHRTGDPMALTMVTRTLEGMDRGGMHDHVGGGFHRYSTDARWHVPHFEKMLYDNAQLATLYTEAWQVTGREDFARVVRWTLTYLREEMRDAGGAFHAATDADSPGPDGESEEGLFFTWTRGELEAALTKEDAAWFAEGFGVPTVAGDERPVLMVRGDRHPADLDPERFRRVAATLEAVRARRAPPLKDDKVVAAWNGLAISAFATAGRAFDEAVWVETAEEAATFVLEQMRGEDGRLRRTWREGRARHPATAEDLAFVTAGLLDLFEATGEARWLREARALHDALESRYGDARGGWYLTPDDGETLLTRPKADYDGAEPAASSVAADNALRLLHWTGEDAYRVQAVRAVSAFGERLRRSPTSLPAMLSALDRALGPSPEVIVVHEGDDPLTAQLRRSFLPRAVQVAVAEGTVASVAAAAVTVEGKVALDGAATAYVCELGACQQPVTTWAALEALLTR